MRTWKTIVNKSVLRRRSDKNDLETIKDTRCSMEFAYSPLKQVYGHIPSTIFIEPNGDARIQVNVDKRPGDYEIY